MMADCPVCNIKGYLEVKTKTEEIPYFGEVMESTVKCQKCGFKHTDSICLDIKEPVKYSLIVDKNKINVRVVKSQSATITIPELGLKVEPGPQSQSYISNVEGVIKRFENAVKTALSWAEDDESRKNAVRILEEIDEVKNGENSVTIIIEDPFGHSLIEDKDAIKTVLSEDEIKNLETGFITFDK